jgi:hypothetical protein
MRILLAAIAATLLLVTPFALAQDRTQVDAGAAAAQSEPSGSPEVQAQAKPAQPVAGRSISRQLGEQLEQAGFRDVMVVPNSFVVRATNKDGHPVVMVVDSDAMTATELVPGRNLTTSGQAPTAGSAPPSAPSGSPGSDDGKK